MEVLKYEKQQLDKQVKWLKLDIFLEGFYLDFSTPKPTHFDLWGQVWPWVFSFSNVNPSVDDFSVIMLQIKICIGMGRKHWVLGMPTVPKFHTRDW